MSPRLRRASCVLLPLLCLACSEFANEDESTRCSAGSFDCPCTSEGTCDDDLACKSGYCARSGSADGAGGSGAGAGGAASGGAAAAEVTCTAEREQERVLELRRPEYPIPDDCVNDLEGTFEARPRDGYLRDGDPASVLLSFSRGTLVAVDNAACVPVSPGNLRGSAYVNQCEQDYVCGCCKISLEQRALTWGIAPAPGLAVPPCSKQVPRATEYWVGGYGSGLPPPSVPSGAGGGSSTSNRCADCLAGCAGSPFCGTGIGANCYDACYSGGSFTPNIPCDPQIQICS